MSEFTRRDFLMAAVPGAWVLELRKGQGIGRLSTPARIGFVKDLILLTSGNILACAPAETKLRSFKDRVLSLKWEQVSSRELEVFTESCAEEYIRLTRTSRVTKDDLLGSGRVNYFEKREEMVKVVKEIDPNYQLSPGQWGYTNFATSKVFIDLDNLRQQVVLQARSNKVDPGTTAGIALLDALWHEWGVHVDVKDRTQGDLINNPKYSFHSPISNKDEQFRRYRGAEIFTDTYYGFARFEEVLGETITVRRMIEQVGLAQIISAADYYQNGVDFFPILTSAIGIPLDTLYQMHATSDFEGINRLIGSKLPGNQDPLEKGIRLALGIHQSDRQLIQQTGALNLLQNRK